MVEVMGLYTSLANKRRITLYQPFECRIHLEMFPMVESSVEPRLDGFQRSGLGSTELSRPAEIYARPMILVLK